MLETLGRLLAAPHFDDPDDATRSRIVNVTYILVTTVLVFMSIVYELSGNNNQVGRIVTIALVILFAILYVWFRRGHLDWPSILLPLASSSIVGVISSQRDGLRDLNMYAIFAIVTLSALLAGKRGLLISGALVLLNLIVIYLLQVTGILANAVPADTAFFIGFVSLFVLTAGLTYLLLDVLEKSRNRAVASEQQLRILNTELEQRVKQRTAELEAAMLFAEAARARSEQADKVKSQFLASMSHELRTPLNAILSFTKLMNGGMFGPVTEEQSEYLLKTQSSGQHLLSLINDVLDISKIESGELKLFLEGDFDPSREMEHLASTAEKMLGDKPVKVIRDIDAGLPTMTCDKRRVRQVLLNVVSNAVKFTEQGSITLSAKAEGNAILFAVIDSGPGIAREDQKLIFEPFVQSETGLKHAGGTGLGLPISRRLVDAHGGSLRLESERGQGAAFFVRLPLVTQGVVAERSLA